MLVMQLQTQDTRGVRRTPLRLRVSQTPSKATQNDSLVCTALLHGGRSPHLISNCVACTNTACSCDWYRWVSADHACVELSPSVSTCNVSLRMLCLHAICLPYERFLWSVREKSVGQVYCVCTCVRDTVRWWYWTQPSFPLVWDWSSGRICDRSQPWKCALVPLKFIVGILMGFKTSSSSLGSQAWYLRIWALVL